MLIVNLLIIVLNKIGGSYAEDGMEMINNSISQQASSFPSETTRDHTESQGPSLRPATISPSVPVVTMAPSPHGMMTPFPSSDSAPAQLVDSCQNTQGWVYNDWIWESDNMICDDFRVQCDHDQGNLGPAKDHCCKCKAEKCKGLCEEFKQSKEPLPAPHTFMDAPPSYSNHEDDDGSIYIFVVLIACSMCVALAIVLLCGKLLQRRNFEDDLAQTRQTMTTRRRQQRESSIPSITEEDRYTARYERFVAMFHFQTIQDEKPKNIVADSIRAENCTIDTEKYSRKEGDATNELATSDEVHENCNESSLTERLSAVWGTMPSSTDDCCICLESYTKGERVCVPITQRCNHVFHEECIFEWIQKKNRCPLCRVDLAMDCKGVVVVSPA